MTTVGIMSMQRIHNYGSTLQAYSLRCLIDATVPDARISFVDYQPGDVIMSNSKASPSKINRTLAKLREYNTIDAPFAERLSFFNHKRAYGKRYFPAVGIPAEPNYDLDLDCQVIGSDEVFNCVQANTNVGYSRDLFGHGSPARRLISYAASFGNTTLAKIRAADIERDLKQDLARFDALSVRDHNSHDIVAKLVGRDPAVHVDPALAHDLMRDPRVPAARLHSGRYLIVYGYSGRLTAEENMALRAYARNADARILTFGGVQQCGDAFVECSPFDLLAYFRDAVAVVTDTFHGTIFSIINHRPFATIIRPSAVRGYGNEEKLGFLLESFGLSSRRLHNAAMIDEVLSTPLPDTAIDATLASERARTKDYLAENIGPMNQGEP